MDAVVLCSKTARAVYRAPNLPKMRIRIPDHASRLAEGAPGIAAIHAARVELEALGVSLGPDSTLDVLVQSVRDKRNDEQTRFLVWDRDVPARAIVRLAPKVFVVSVEFCAFEAAKEMDELELIEYYFELCSTYALPEGGGDYLDRPRPLTTVARLRTFFLSIPKGCHGRTKALRALRSVRDGARSPMETAMTMPMTVRKALGGLQIRDLEMNRRVELSDQARAYTRRSYVVCDVHIRRGNQDVEYQGARHDEELQQAIDNERRHALQAMGFTIVEVNKEQLFNPVSFRRLMATIAGNAHIDLGGYPEGFAGRQEELRRFVIRRWTRGKGSTIDGSE